MTVANTRTVLVVWMEYRYCGRYLLRGKLLRLISRCNPYRAFDETTEHEATGEFGTVSQATSMETDLVLLRTYVTKCVT